MLVLYGIIYEGFILGLNRATCCEQSTYIKSLATTLLTHVQVGQFYLNELYM